MAQSEHHAAPAMHAQPAAHQNFGARPQQSAPIERRSPEPTANAPGAGHAAPIERRPNSGVNGRGDHLPEWLSQHSNLSPEQQQQALEREPGFRELPEQTQARYRQRLAQLDAMSPDKRQRMLERNEMMEHLTPDQRREVREATQQWAALPPDERRVVARSFRALRALPPDQRGAALASGRYTAPFNAEQRAALNRLMEVEPMMPPDPPQQVVHPPPPY
jgi:hypothetical protein